MHADLQVFKCSGYNLKYPG